MATETAAHKPAAQPITVPAGSLDGFCCEQYKGIETDSGNYFKNYAFLGKGGSGIAYLVQATSGAYRGGLFVLKGLHRTSDSARLKRFRQERAFLKTLNHPNLLRLIDEGEYYGRPFIVQPYAPETLRQALGGKALPFGTALAFACQLLSALQALHNQNVLHRDIKPENIFVNGAHVQLGDFGLMKRLDGAADAADRGDFQGYRAGAFYYRTPELAAYANGTGALDLRSDIFQLGLVLAELFSGRNPLSKAENFTDAISLNSVARINGRYAPRVVSAINGMLAINPGERASIEKALDDFTGIFEQYAKDHHDLHGQFFLN
ncbi:serine/threonine protein kinase [Candidatus Tokpelaia sp.]|uniref:serine/threonine protein kinase n=1 Tax=Candidatus Tokpelaia sp. TaxID=2233777 RepID=UPI00123A66C1|nr:serine/threonine-protein kinase [Candidatus Tokpelaia sp.]KAA6404842.1 hypothetical protein DPQ22_07995 [Candidatus Tokpelaia sp.]